MPQSVFLVKQDLSFLYGRYLVQAVVVAADEAAAVEDVTRLRSRDIAVHRRRLTTTRLGPLDLAEPSLRKLAILSGTYILAYTTGTDHDRPPSPLSDD